MVRDLEHIDGSAAGQAVPEELWVDVLLHVPGQQHPSLAVADVQYHRDVVDASSLIRRAQWHLARSRPEHADRDAVEGERVAGRQQDATYGRSAQHLSKRLVTGPSADHAGLSDDRHAIAFQEERQPRRVILVWMGQDRQVEAAVPSGDPFVEQRQELIGVGTAIDQHARAARPLHEHGITLSHVQDRDAQTAVGPAAGE